MRALALSPTWTWLLLLVGLPALLLGVIALATAADGVPPYTLGTSLDALATALSDPFYLRGFLASLRVAGISAALCLLIGYPMALAIAQAAEARQRLLLLLIVLPFWTGFLLRIAAWVALLRDDGWLNAGLLAVNLVERPLPLLHTDFAMYAGIVHAYLPFMILPLHARLSKRDVVLEEAAVDLGATRWGVFLHVTWPLSLPGVAAGLALVFVPVTGEYVIPELLGGAGSQTVGRVIWDEFFTNHDWPQAAALAVVLLVALLLPALAIRRAG